MSPFGRLNTLSPTPAIDGHSGYIVSGRRPSTSTQSSAPFSPHASSASSDSGSSLTHHIGPMESHWTRSRTNPTLDKYYPNGLQIEYPGPPRLDVPHLSPSSSTGRYISSSLEEEESLSRYFTQPTTGRTSGINRPRRDTQASDNSRSTSLSPNGNGNVALSPTNSYQDVNTPIERQRTPSYPNDMASPVRQLSRPAVGISASPHQVASLLPPIETHGGRMASIDTYRTTTARSFTSTLDSHHSNLDDAINSSDISVYTSQGEVRFGTLEGFTERLIGNFSEHLSHRSAGIDN